MRSLYLSVLSIYSSECITPKLLNEFRVNLMFGDLRSKMVGVFTLGSYQINKAATSLETQTQL